MEKVDIKQAKDIFVSEFSKEKDLCDYLEHNIKLFCIDFLNIEYKSHIREFEAGVRPRFQARGRRVDFMIEDSLGNIHLVEVKNPKTESENIQAIGQILSYGSLFNQFDSHNRKFKTLNIVTTKFDFSAYLTIMDFNLPISLFTMNKSSHICEIYKC